MWLRKLFDLSCEEYLSLGMDDEDPMDYFDAQFNSGLENVTLKEIELRLNSIEKQMQKWSSETKLYSYQADDILKLKYYHQRYNNYKRWLLWKK